MNISIGREKEKRESDFRVKDMQRSFTVSSLMLPTAWQKHYRAHHPLGPL